jgi:hypothetical protein
MSPLHTQVGIPFWKINLTLIKSPKKLLLVTVKIPNLDVIALTIKRGCRIMSLEMKDKLHWNWNNQQRAKQKWADLADRHVWQVQSGSLDVVNREDCKRRKKLYQQKNTSIDWKERNNTRVCRLARLETPWKTGQPDLLRKHNITEIKLIALIFGPFYSSWHQYRRGGKPVRRPSLVA